MAKLIVGCGYLGSRVARRWLEAGEEVWATTRSPLRANDLRDRGIQPLVLDVTTQGPSIELPVIDTALYAVGYDRSAPQSMREVYVEGLNNVLDSLSGKLGRLIYISSTGVYGQQEGDRVDENSPCRPNREGGRICLEAEETLREHELGKRAIVLRLAGIYGPNRIPRRADIAAGNTISSPAEGAMNLIHVDDAAEIVLQLEQQVEPPELFCVSDGKPVERREYYRYLAQLIDAPAPQFSESSESEAVSQRAKSSKQVDSSKLLSVLDRPLRYPSYREGLAAIIAGNE